MNPVASFSTYFRAPSDEGALLEDGCCINIPRFAGVVDGASAGYSPSNPPLMYPGGLSGGQIVQRRLLSAIMDASSSSNLPQIVLQANEGILSDHRKMGVDPTKGDDVGEGCCAVCHIGDLTIELLLVGDCFALWRQNGRYFFITGSPPNSFKTEFERMQHFERCLIKAGGDKGKAWDLYHPFYQKDRSGRANKAIEEGGYSSLNGDPALKHLWARRSISRLANTDWIVLGTDGLLPLLETDPRKRSSLVQTLGDLYSQGGIKRIIQWRDTHQDCQPHIGQNNWPEAAAAEIKFW